MVSLPLMIWKNFLLMFPWRVPQDILWIAKGVYSKTIMQEIPVIKKDNFEDLIKDGNIVEAIRFIEVKK